jgi:pilus assembly protein CpaF
VIERIVASVGRRVDEASPMVDARLPDGSRVNAIIPPLAVDGPALTIRKFAVDPYRIDDLIAFKTLTPAMASLLDSCVRGKLNILISGGTGSGKTTLLNVMSSFVPGDERIVTIEDAVELQLLQEHVVRLESRPPNVEGKGQVTIRDLVRNSLRMRPDRIIVGEVRGAEALDMLQAMNTGHEGSMSTLHANSPRDALSRLETMVLMAGLDIPVSAVREYISSAVSVIVQLSRLSDGTRRITQVTEVVGMEGEIITMQDVFRFVKRGVDDQGKVIGGVLATGIRPKFAEKLAEAGLPLAAELFANAKERAA